MFPDSSQVKSFISKHPVIKRLYVTFIRGNRMQLKKTRGVSDYYLNIGCGSNVQPGFINIDYNWHPGIDICWDITKGIPFPDNSVKGIFTEHCLEHISYFQCYNLLKEFHRVLCFDGTVRIIVPDGELYLDLYQKGKNGDTVEFPYLGATGKKHLDEDSPIGFTPMMAVNRIFRGYNHQFAYDIWTLEVMLKNAGFDDVRRESCMHGRDKNLLVDSEYRKPQSLYVEASTSQKTQKNRN